MVISCSEDGLHAPEVLLDTLAFEGKVSWIRNYGGEGSDTGQSVIRTSDGGYAVLGYTNSMTGDITDKSSPVNDYWLLKLADNGDIEWSRTYGGSKDDRGQTVIQTSDGGYAIVGYAMSSDGDGSNNEGFHDNWILKLDSAGTIEWERSFGFAGHDHSYDIVQTDDGGFFFVGFLDVVASRGEGGESKGNSLTRHGVGEFWGTKLDAQGNLQWRRYFGGTNNDRAHAVALATDGGYVLSGFSESDDADISLTKGSYDFWVIRLDAAGELVWERTFGGSGIDISYDIANTDDGAFLISGNTFSSDTDVLENNGESDIWIIKIDDEGRLMWQAGYGGQKFDAAQSVNSFGEGNFIVSGNTRSSDGDISKNAGQNDMWVVLADANGQLLWQQTFGGTGLDFGFDAVESHDGGIMLVGESGSSDLPMAGNKGKSDLILIKIN